MTSSPAEGATNEEKWSGGNDTLGEHQHSDVDINVHGEPMEQFETVNNNNGNKVVMHAETIMIFPS